jgi:FRG domain
MKPTGTVTCLQDLLSEIDKLKLSHGKHVHSRVWFRGQPEQGLPLLPGVYRSKFPARNESERVGIEQHLTQQFCVQSSGLRCGRDAHAEIYFLLQHYKLPTRLLEWTTNPLAALYFCAVDERDLDGELFVMDVEMLAIKQAVGENQRRRIATQRSEGFIKAIDVIFKWGDLHEFPNYIIPIVPDYMDTRINCQNKCFTFHVPKHKELSINENNTLRCFMIPHGGKETILNELCLLGIDGFSVLLVAKKVAEVCQDWK